MQATLNGRVIAESDDVIACKGYLYFQRSAVQMNLIEPAANTASDLECPHGVQFYDVVLDGTRYARAAWSYEAPQPAIAHVGGRIGFWNEVKIG